MVLTRSLQLLERGQCNSERIGLTVHTWLRARQSGASDSSQNHRIYQTTPASSKSYASSNQAFAYKTDFPLRGTAPAATDLRAIMAATAK